MHMKLHHSAVFQILCARRFRAVLDTADYIGVRSREVLRTALVPWTPSWTKATHGTATTARAN